MEKHTNVNNAVAAASNIIQFEGNPSDAQKDEVVRLNLFNKLKKNISCLFQCLEQIPKNELERLIALDEQSASIKILSLNIRHEMEALEEKLLQEVATNRKEGDWISTKVRELWSCLAGDEEVRSVCEKVHKPSKCQLGEKHQTVYRAAMLKGLRSELSRLENMALALLIGQVRDELSTIWTTKCFMKDAFSRFKDANYANLTKFSERDFVSDIYTEELVEKHQVEVNYWRKFVDRNNKIIDAVIKRQKMFSRYLEFDQKSDDPSRLANRGGALLQEEKQRKMLENSIPKLENELKDLNMKFNSDEQAGGQGMQMFLVYGQTIPDFIVSDWANFHEERNLRKEMRKKDADDVNKTMMATQIRPPKRPGPPGGIAGTPKRAKIPPSTLRIPFGSAGCSMKKPNVPIINETNPRGKPPVGTKNYTKKALVPSVHKSHTPATGSRICNPAYSTARKFFRKSSGRKTVHSNGRLGSLLMSATNSSIGSSAVSEDNSYNVLNSFGCDPRTNNVISLAASSDENIDKDNNFARPATRSRFATPNTGANKEVVGTRTFTSSNKETQTEAKEQINPAPVTSSVV